MGLNRRAKALLHPADGVSGSVQFEVSGNTGSLTPTRALMNARARLRGSGWRSRGISNCTCTRLSP